MKKLAVAVLLGVAVACSSGGGGNTERQGNTEATEQVLLTDQGVPAQTAGCGIERWAVKTGTDPGASKVDQTPVPATVANLAAMTAPKNPLARVAPTEDTTYQVSATLSEFKTEADSDYHLVLSSGAKTSRRRSRYVSRRWNPTTTRYSDRVRWRRCSAYRPRRLDGGRRTGICPASEPSAVSGGSVGRKFVPGSRT
jgi:hypothetical protein